MKIKMLKDYLDFKEGKEYEILGPSGDHLVRQKIAKYVTDKDGNAKEDKKAVETKELKTDTKTK
jgi:hypothetical protein